MKDDLKKPNIERLLTVMRGGIADRVPNYEILLEASNVKALLGRDVGTTWPLHAGQQPMHSTIRPWRRRTLRKSAI